MYYTLDACSSNFAVGAMSSPNWMSEKNLYSLFFQNICYLMYHFLKSTFLQGNKIIVPEVLIFFSFPFSSLLQPRIDDKHSRWLHLRIRPSSFPYLDTGKYPSPSKVKVKALVDGRWTLAFRDEESCKSALSMILEEINFQSVEVERRIKPLLDIK